VATRSGKGLPVVAELTHFAILAQHILNEEELVLFLLAQDSLHVLRLVCLTQVPLHPLTDLGVRKLVGVPVLIGRCLKLSHVLGVLLLQSHLAEVVFL